MKRKFFVLVLSFCSGALSAQEKIEKFYDISWNECEPAYARFYSRQIKKDSFWLKQDFYWPELTLQMEGHVKNGLKEGIFTFYHPNKQISSRGFYQKGKRVGLHRTYHENGPKKDSTFYLAEAIRGNSYSWYASGKLQTLLTLDSMGTESGNSISYFENGNISSKGTFLANLKKNGLWNYYHENGNKAAEVTYIFDKINSKKCFNEAGDEQVDCQLERVQAEFPGGITKLSKFFSKKIKWPPNYILTKDGKARVIVGFIVNKKGKITDIKVVQSFHEEFDKMAVKAIEEMPDWLPAKEFNRKVSVYFMLPVNFAQ